MGERTREEAIRKFEEFIDGLPEFELRVRRHDGTYRASIVHADRGKDILAWFNPTPEKTVSTIESAKGRDGASPEQAILELIKRLRGGALLTRDPKPTDPFMVYFVDISVPDFGL